MLGVSEVEASSDCPSETHFEENFIEEWSFDGKVDLDSRLLAAIGNLGFFKPTEVQQRSIPLLIQGKDVFMRCSTGSGKTLAYCIPVVQKILFSLTNGASNLGVKVLILTPTRDLCWQVTEILRKLVKYCEISVEDLCRLPEAKCEDLKQGNFSILVGTPAKVLPYIKRKLLNLKSLESLVIDEADLILSYGYYEDACAILEQVTPGYQGCLASATLSSDVDSVRNLILRDPVAVELNERADNSSIKQYYTVCTKLDRYLYLYYILKFKMNPFGSGKTIIFVNNADEGFKVKVFLDLFGIRCSSLNPYLPIESRLHILQEFNRDVYDHIIAVDENLNNESFNSSKNVKNRSLSYGSSRGIDFKKITAIINFDFPQSVESYTHRSGRTGRGPNGKGWVLSFIIGENLQTVYPNDHLINQVMEDQKCRGCDIKNFTFNTDDTESFRYRVENTLRSVTKKAIRDTRLKEIKKEILNSSKLKSHLESNKKILKTLRHDSNSNISRMESRVSYVPNYLLPRTLKSNYRNLPSTASRKETLGNIQHHSKSKWRRNRKNKNPDPLKNFKA